MGYLLGILMFLSALFLTLLVLVQRGRGGGLSGALGGMGGQSAFGTKAGDLFTRITIGAAAFWILLSMVTIVVLNGSTSKLDDVPSTGGITTGNQSGLDDDLDSKSGAGEKTGETPGGLGGETEKTTSGDVEKKESSSGAAKPDTSTTGETTGGTEGETKSATPEESTPAESESGTPGT